ncbi:MAG: hypothetical protein K6C33_08020 [Desulfovibrio sp.]|jgi:hypothetical protein|nr:hypothetical protein [Desulfovibrio sp.]
MLERTTRGIIEGDELPACGSWPRTRLKWLDRTDYASGPAKGYKKPRAK